MEEQFVLSLPRKNNETEAIECPQSLVLIGANGSGKTRLGTWIEMDSPQKEKVHRISAQKSLTMPDNVMPKSIQLAENELLHGHKDSNVSNHIHYKKGYRWGNLPATFLLNDFDKLMVYLFSEFTDESVKYLNESKRTSNKVMAPITKLDLVKQVWEKVLPHRQLILNGLNVQTCTAGNEENAYSASEMSDGERVVFYLIGQCLAAPEDGVIVIDEPEIHLHKSIQAPLWIEIQKLRPDCLFVYMTHDVDFAVSLPNSQKIWLKSYDGSNWDWELVQDVDGLPENLLIEILGSRKPIVLVEGVKGSFDSKLYQAILDGFLVIPNGSCTEVISTVKALKSSGQLHHLDVYGVIDRDRRVENEVESLKDHSIYTLEVAEVENLFCVPEMIKIVSAKLERNPDEDSDAVASFVINRLQSELEKQVSLHVASEIKFQLNCFNDKATGEDNLKVALSSLTDNIKVDKIYSEKEALFTEAIESSDYLMLLKIYNRKSLASQISGIFGLQKNELAKMVLRLVNSESKEEVKQALKPYFGEFSNKIS
jgi:energy-coupling factor transporter ATP-binding protein EcfA2